MKKLLVYLKDYKKECVLAPLFKLLEASFELLVPLVMASIIDVGIANNDKPYIIKLGCVLVLLGVIGLASSITAQYFSAKAAVGFSKNVRHALFKHIESLSFDAIDRIGTSTMITRLTSDTNQVQNGVNMVLRLFLRSPFIVAGAMFMAFTIDVKASLIFVVVVAALTLVICVIMKITMPLYKKVQNALDGVLLSTRENITGVRVIRAFNKEEDEIKSFDEKNDVLSKLQIYVGKVSGLMNPLTYAIVNIGIILLIYKGAIYVDNSVLQTGEVIALINYMSQILVELVKLANLIVTVTKSFACANRISDVFDIEPAASFDGDTSGVSEFDKDSKDEFVVFDNVCMSYYGASNEALSDITFSVKKGMTVGIIGGTGSGKSTLVHMIPGFYKPCKGGIKIGGHDINEWNITALREKIGIVLQKAVLFKGTIRDNMYWGREDISEDELKEVINISQSAEIVEKKEGGLDAVIEQAGRNLSGGQKQRLTIARALARKPDILILDDSSSALDYATDAKLRKALKELKGETTIFVVSQRTSSIAHADMIIVMDDGCIAGIGTHESLLNDCELYREIHSTQLSD